jgi:hypothetical protein
METLDRILQKYVAVGDETTDKVLGAALVVVDKDGTLILHLLLVPCLVSFCLLKTILNTR